jgi:hypothetical protein
LDPELATAAIEIASRFPDASWGQGRFFADRVPIASDAAPHDRLAALLGRTPHHGA